MTSHLAASQNMIIDRVCNQTLFPKFCKNAIYSDSRSEMASTQVFGDISIDFTRQSVSTAITFLKRNIRRSHHPTKNHLKACKATCHTLMNNMGQAKTLWRDENFRKTKNIATRSILALHEGCNYRLQNSMFGHLNENILILMRFLYIVEAVCDFALVT